jgi:hypothetical protein
VKQIRDAIALKWVFDYEVIYGLDKDKFNGRFAIL